MNQGDIMKKILCLLLVVTMLLSVGTIYVSATDTQQSYEFSTNEELLSYLREYATDFSDAGITPPTDDHWLENKKVVLPELSSEYATLDGYTCVKNENRAINSISSSYTLIDSEKKIVMNAYYDLTRADIMDSMEGFDERSYHDPDLYDSVQTEEYALNVKIVTIDGKKKTIFRIVYDDKLIVIEMDGAITREEYNSIIEILAFTETDVSLPVYVCGKVNLFEEIVVDFASSPFYYYYYYKEIYYHYDSNNEVDWALVYINAVDPRVDPGIRSAIYKDRLLSGLFRVFDFNYGVYDVKKGRCYDVFDEKFKFEDYEGLDEALTAYEPGDPHGDVDRDKALTVIDATLIQRAVAGLYVYEFDVRDDELYGNPAYGSWYKDEGPKYMSDYDRDGERTVMDATAIQKKLVQG